MNYYFTDRIDSNFNAGSKAVNDVERILDSKGYKPVKYGCNGVKNFIIRRLVAIYRLLLFLLRIKKGDTVFIQYPIRAIPKKEKARYRRFFSLGKVKLVCLIHDLPSIRHGLEKGEDPILWLSDVVICHTPAMREYLIGLGLDKDKIRILYLFDYLTDSENEISTSFGTGICFAGNLAKSEFIEKLSEVADLDFLLYGLPEREFPEGSNVVYQGKFHPDDISQIQGDWGLVWDGTDIDTCDGLYGKYLKINSPHKLSLYLASGKPVIVWEQSALKDYVLDNHLGISVGSLSEIKDKVMALTESEKVEIAASVKLISKELKSGKMLGEMEV